MLKKFCRYETILYLRSINLKTTNMDKEQILELLTEQEAHLFTSLTNAKLVFGEDSEAFKVARARWSTTYELLKKIQNENN